MLQKRPKRSIPRTTTKRLSIFLSYFNRSFVSFYEIAMFPIPPFLWPWNEMLSGSLQFGCEHLLISAHTRKHIHTQARTHAIQPSLNPQMYSQFNDLHSFVMAQARFGTRLHARIQNHTSKSYGMEPRLASFCHSLAWVYCVCIESAREHDNIKANLK